jgi:chemotaxis protein methyltransferase CheR
MMAGWKVEIFASDISEEILQKARRGEYQGLTLRNVNPALLGKYFTKQGELYRVSPEIKALVKFSQLNLNDQRKVSLMNNMDVIFCRNVMIYFSDEVKKHLVRGFFNNLRPGGYLYIGHSETLHGVSKAFKLVYFKNALVYQKEAAEGGASRPVSGTTRTSVGAGAGAGGGASRAMDLLSQVKQPATAGK